MAGKPFDKLMRWLGPRGGKTEAEADRLLAHAEHELSKVRRDLEGVLGPQRDNIPAAIQRKL